MRKLLLFFIVIFLSACASVVNPSLVSKSPLSIKRFVTTCGTPVESYFVQQLGVRVHRHKNCMGVNDLLSLVWAGDLSQNNIDGVSLLAVMYASHLTRIDSEASYIVNLLKIDSFVQNGLDTHVAFFKIKRKINK
jgi:hypothetical protein